MTNERRFDLTCSQCQKDGRGTYELPVRCSNCGTSGVGAYSKSHESYSPEKCPDCECTTLRVSHKAAT